MQAPPEPMQLPLEEYMQTSWRKQSSCISLALTSQTGHPHQGTTPVRLVPLTGQADATWETARAQK
jgi:hypothetical protein